MNHKAIGVIPARFASSRFPGKPLVKIGEKTMIRRVYEQAVKSRHLSKTVVATDDQRIMNEVTSFGGKAEMTSAAHKNGTSRCAEVVKKSPQFEIVVNIQGDEPFINPSDIDVLIEAFEDPKVLIATLAKELDLPADLEDGNTVKVGLDENSFGFGFSRKATSLQNAEVQSEKKLLKHVGLYAFKANLLPTLVNLRPTENEKAENLEQLRWLDHGYAIKVVKTHNDSISIDSPDDLNTAIAFLEQHPEF